MSDRSLRFAGTNGKGVLLVHGLTGAPAEMLFLAKRLNKRGFTILAPQLAGHCQDVDALLKTSWQDWLGSVRDAYRELAQTTSEVYIAGICVGGALGLALAASEPGVQRAAIYSMTFEYDGWNMKRWYRLAPLMWLLRLLPMMRSVRFEEPYPYGLKDERLRERVQNDPGGLIEGALPVIPLGSLHEMYKLARHIEKIGATVRQRTLIVHAREDDMSDVRNAHRLARALGGPVDFRLMEDSYHMVHVDRERNLVADITAQFFGAQLERASGTAEATAESVNEYAK